MESIYIDHAGTSLEVEAGRLLIRHPSQPRATSVPLTHLKWLVISANTALTSTVLNALTRSGVCLVSLNPRRSDAVMVSLPFTHGAAERRYRQYRWLSDDSGRGKAACQLVRYKVLSQCRMLMKLRRRRPDLRYAMTTGICQLKGLLVRLRSASVGYETLLGMEGAAAHAYFEALSAAFAPSLKFSRRNRRPPTDPVNALLSLGYTLLHAEAVRALASVGLDPMLGFYHALDYGRESLACDLVETERVSIDTLVHDLFSAQVLRVNHFSEVEGKCLLGKAGRAIFYSSYEQVAQSLRSRMRRRSLSWAKFLDRCLIDA